MAKINTKQLSQLANDLSFRPQYRLGIFRELKANEQIQLLRLLSSHVRKDILERLPQEELVALLSKVDPDEATDLVQLFDSKKRDKILEELSEDLKSSISKLLRFDPDTAAGLMSLDYIQVDIDENIEMVAKRFKLHEKRTGRPPLILITKDDHLEGYLPGHELAFIHPSTKVAKHTKHTPSIAHSANHSEVINLFKSHPHDKIVVLNDDRTILGVIYSDDVLRLIQEQGAASLYHFAGVSKEEGVADSGRRKVKFRYKWLIINLATAFLAAFTVGLFEETISKYVLLAVYMPIVAGMGGNAATQTLAVVVRGIALRQIDIKTAYRTLKNELEAGFANGLINGFLVAFIVLVKDQDVKIAMILALAMVANLLVAALFGTIVPLIMSKLKKDPASSATIFITTATDVLGFLVFLGLAQLILP